MYKQAMSHWWNWGGNQKLPGKMIIYQTGNITIFCNNFKFSIICNNIKPLFVHLKLTLHCKSTILQWKKTWDKWRWKHNNQKFMSVHTHAQLCLTVTPRTVAHQALLSMKFSRQQYLSGLPFSSPVNLPDPGIEPASVAYIGKQILYHCATLRSPGL